MLATDVPRNRWAGPLSSRYTTADLRVLSEEEACRFAPSPDADPQTDITLAWELLYRLEPQLYDRLVQAEPLHPAIRDWLPDRVDTIVEVGAGTGRLTLDLIARARELVAIEPAAPLRRILTRRLAQTPQDWQVNVRDGFFDALPNSSDWADLVVTCSALTRDEGHGGEAGLTELERVCRPGGQVVIVWPNNLGWLAEHGYRHLSFPGTMSMRFAGPAEAVEIAQIFYPRAVDEVRRRGRADVPYDVVGINPPRDLAVKVIPG